MKKITFDPARLQTPVTVLYDSKNSASLHEVEFLKTKNSDGSKLAFINLSASPESAGEFGVSVEDARLQLHARDAAGQVLAGIDAIYAAHAAVGLASWFEMCRIPGFLSVGTGIGPRH